MSHNCRGSAAMPGPSPMTAIVPHSSFNSRGTPS
jgi:hypothetical protein